MQSLFAVRCYLLELILAQERRPRDSDSLSTVRVTSTLSVTRSELVPGDHDSHALRLGNRSGGSALTKSLDPL